MRREPKADELLAAYVDGVSELTPDERKRVEAAIADGTGRDELAATRDVLARLRDLPPAGTEPDWSALERAIGDAVGPDVPRPWWRRWRWALPVAALGATAALALVVVVRPGDDRVAEPIAKAPVTMPQAPAPTVALYLDGRDLELELGDGLEDALDDLDVNDPAVAGFLTQADLASADESEAMVDDLDDESLDRLEGWLEHHGSKG